MTKPPSLLAGLVLTALSALAAWCAVTEDPARIVELVSARPWIVKALVVAVIADSVATIWLVDAFKWIMARREREAGQ